MEELDAKRYFDTNQFGSIKGRSMEQAITMLVNNIKSNCTHEMTKMSGMYERFGAFVGGANFKRATGKIIGSIPTIVAAFAAYSGGKVILPPLNSYPDFLKNSLSDPSKQAMEFRSNIGSYNSTFSFASFNANFCDFTKGPALIKNSRTSVPHEHCKLDL